MDLCAIADPQDRRPVVLLLRPEGYAIANFRRSTWLNQHDSQAQPGPKRR